jgi:hypothetical protein
MFLFLHQAQKIHSAEAEITDGWAIIIHTFNSVIFFPGPKNINIVHVVAEFVF